MSSIITGEAVVLDLRPAGFAPRMASALIDVLVALLAYVLLVLLLWQVLAEADFTLLRALLVGSAVLVFVIAPATVETVTRGKSLGRLAMGLRIVRDDGGSVRFRHAIIRAVTAVLEIYALSGALAFFVAVFNARSKRLGDVLAGTYALQERVHSAPRQPVLIPPELAGWAQLADLGRLPDPLSRRISRFLGQTGGMAGPARTSLAAELAAETVPYVSPQPPAGTHPEAYLRAVTGARRDRDFARLERSRLQAAALGKRLHRTPFSRQ